MSERTAARTGIGNNVTTAADMLSEGSARRSPLRGIQLFEQMTDAQMGEVAEACNRYPNIEVNYEVVNADEVEAGDSVEMVVSLERELDDDGELTQVGSVMSTPSSWRRRRVKTTSCAATDAATISASQLESATDFCFLEP